jgi:adenylate cyclase
MGKEGFKRKLTAIFSADAKGYSRLMGEDEAATVQTLKTFREIMASHIQQYGGWVVDSPGDNLLAEFGSVVDALDCAVKIQHELKEKNSEFPEQSRMNFRIGVNLGDVIEDDERIYGDGVNVAARVEGLADGGGICISGTAYDQIAKKLPLGYEYLGEQKVKNIEKPVRVYRVLMDPEAAGKVIGEKRFLGKISHGVALSAIIILVIVAGGLIGWNIYLHQSRKIEPASLDKMAYPLPDKPSIAVLPFDNMGGDPEQEYFSDGLTEDIITALSKVPRLFVIARNSVFTYKGKPVKAQQVAEELGVRYVLEGSVRQSGDRVRITAQLIDATNGRHLWAEKYDSNLKNMFTLQDEITQRVLTSLEVKLTEGEQARVWSKGTNNREAYEKYSKALEYFRLWTKDGNLLARQLWKEAIELDPQYAVAYVSLAYTHSRDSLWGWSKSPKQSFQQAEELAEKALSLDDSLSDAYALLGNLSLWKGQYDQAVSYGEKAVNLLPNGADVTGLYALNLSASGRQDEAIVMFNQSIRLNPITPDWVFQYLGRAYILAGRFDDAIVVLNKILTRNPDFLGAHVYLTAAYNMAGREKDARASSEEVLKINPKFSLESFSKLLKFKDEADKKLLINAMLKAGLPE